MKDIDFDELDKAVSSVLGAEPGATKPVDEAASNASGIGSATSPSTNPSAVGSISDANAAGNTDKKPFVQKRKTGKFMDVVPPASVAKSRNTPVPVSRQATTLAPTSVSVVPEEPVASEKPATSEFSQTGGYGLDLDNRHTMPDPLDFSGFNADNDKENSKDESVNKDEPAEVEELVKPEETPKPISVPDLPPLDTPLVSGSTVEKRPLGAFSASGETQNTPAKAESDNKEEGVSGASQSQPVSQESASGSEDIPEELRGDLVAIESREIGAPVAVSAPSLSSQTSSPASAVPQVAKPPLATPPVATSPVSSSAPKPASASASVPPVPSAESTSVPRAESSESEPAPRAAESAPKPTPASTVSPGSAAAAPAVASAGSIPQQYTEKPSTKADEETPVFDTKDYHQPISKNADKKGNTITIIIIVSLIVLGAGAGAVFYFLDPFGLL